MDVMGGGVCAKMARIVGCDGSKRPVSGPLGMNSRCVSFAGYVILALAPSAASPPPKSVT